MAGCSARTRSKLSFPVSQTLLLIPSGNRFCRLLRQFFVLPQDSGA